jgi:asparagine N-glycosylation enzyme membrane subunit Stt3
MNFVKEASKLLTNKYFLYFMVFLAATNMLGYLVTNKLNALIFFALVALITFQFSKNMAVVLLVAIIATNFLMSTNLMREGLENQSAATTTNSSTDSSNVNSTPTPDSKKEIVKNKIEGAVEQALADDSSDRKSKIIDTNNTDLNKNVSKDEPEGVVQSANVKGKTEEHFGPRLDYAATIEQSYQNLDELLGSDSIKQLTSDTQKLMAQQQNLFNTMNQMAPVLEGATTMLKTFDIKGLTESLKNISPLKNAPTVSVPKKN